MPREIDLNYARIASIQEDMRLLRDQMFNAWREGPSTGQAGPNRWDEGPSMGQDECRVGQEGPSMAQDGLDSSMGQDDCGMSQGGPYFSNATPTVIGSYLQYNVEKGTNVHQEGPYSRTPSSTPLQSYVCYTIRFPTVDFKKLYKLVTSKGRRKDSVRLFDIKNIYVIKFLFLIRKICLFEVVAVYIGC